MSENRGFSYHNVDPVTVFRFSGNSGELLPEQEGDRPPHEKTEVPIVAILKHQKQLEARNKELETRVADLERQLKEKA